MSGDRLAEIEANARRVIGEDAVTAPHRLWHPWALDLADDVLFLVEIAKAARTLEQGGRTPEFNAVLAPLRSALARLDSGAAEGDAE